MTILAKARSVAYTFVLDYKELVTELYHVMETVDVVFTKVKKEGLSHTSAKYCKDYIWINLLREGRNSRRMQKSRSCHKALHK